MFALLVSPPHHLPGCHHVDDHGDDGDGGNVLASLDVYVNVDANNDGNGDVDFKVMVMLVVLLMVMVMLMKMMTMMKIMMFTCAKSVKSD